MTTFLQRQGLTRPLLLLIAFLYIVDQLTKWWIVFNYQPPGRAVVDGVMYGIVDQTPVIEGFFNIVRVHNTGVAFGFGNGTAWATYVFFCVPIIAFFVVLYLFRKGVFSTPVLKLCGALLLAGILGNFTDRVFQGFFLPGAESLGFWENLKNGYVVDFLDVVIPGFNYHWPSFNVADSCVSVTSVLLFFALMFTKFEATPSNSVK